jgi:hypothetical protein
VARPGRMSGAPIPVLVRWRAVYRRVTLVEVAEVRK